MICCEKPPCIVLHGVRYANDLAVCHHCGKGPCRPHFDNSPRRRCCRCEVKYFLCEACRRKGAKLTPMIVRDPILGFATGTVRAWWCNGCLDEIG
jgi:hypothetical protein